MKYCLWGIILGMPTILCAAPIIINLSPKIDNRYFDRITIFDNGNLDYSLVKEVSGSNSRVLANRFYDKAKNTREYKFQQPTSDTEIKLILQVDELSNIFLDALFGKQPISEEVYQERIACLKRVSKKMGRNPNKTALIQSLMRCPEFLEESITLLGRSLQSMVDIPTIS